MKEYTVTIIRETRVKVTIDESVVDKEALNAIQKHFDNDLFELDGNVGQSICEENYTEEEIGYMNYARYAALHKIELVSEFITLDKHHTMAIIDEDNFEFSIDNRELEPWAAL